MNKARTVKRSDRKRKGLAKRRQDERKALLRRWAKSQELVRGRD